MYLFKTFEELHTMIEDAKDVLRSFPGLKDMEVPVGVLANIVETIGIRIYLDNLLIAAKVECCETISEKNPLDNTYTIIVKVKLSPEEQTQAEKELEVNLERLKNESPELLDVVAELDDIIYGLDSELDGDV